MDPRAVELSDIIKFHPTEESLKSTSISRDDALHVSKEPFTIWQRKNDGTMEKFAPKNTLLVSETGGDFKTIKDALDSIIDATQLNQYIIQVGPGNYLENNPIQCKEWVSINSIGGATVTAVIAKNTNKDLFIMDAFVSIRGFNFFNVLGSGYAVNMSVSGESVITDCIVAECSNGFLINNVTATLNITNCVIFNSVVTTARGLYILAGSLIVTIFKALVGSAITTLIELDGANVIAVLNNITSFGSGLGTAIIIKNGAEVLGAIGNIQNCTDGLVLSGNNIKVRFDVLKLLNASQDGFRIENVGTGIELKLFATTIVGCQRFNFNVLNPNAIVVGNGFTELDQSFVVPGAKFYAYLLDIKEDDEGLNVIGELHVGLPERPTESVFGEGDSYTRGMLVYTETDLGVFTDVSISARSASGSNFTYPGVEANNAIYVASSLVGELDVLDHFGIKTKINTAAVKGSGSIIIEYWNGSSWIEVACMEVESSDQYFPHANNYFEQIGSFHIRYDSQLAIDNWAKYDPMFLGTDYYWIRYRIVSDIDTAPIFEQFKLHTNRSEINADGWIEYFGKARPIGQLNLNFSASKPFEGNMQSQTLYVNEDVGVGFTQNKFTLANDKSGIAGFLPFDFDTSSPIILEWSGMPLNSQTIQWTIRVDWVTDNGSDEYFTTEPSLILGRKEVVVSKAIIANKVSMFKALIDVKEMVSRRDGAFGDELWVSIQPTIISGTFAITSSQATYTKWCNGGHI